eukprot:67114-Pyramimonas_sp.AAC.1
MNALLRTGIERARREEDPEGHCLRGSVVVPCGSEGHCGGAMWQLKMLDEIDRQVNGGQSDQLDDLLQKFLASREEGGDPSDRGAPAESPAPAKPQGGGGM